MLILIFLAIIVIYGILINIDIRHKEKEIQSRQKTITSTDESIYIRDEKTNTIRRRDGKPISDEEVPYLIRLGYQHALEQEKQSKNIKFQRTEKEEELSFQFEMNHGDDITKRIDSFEECYRLACEEDDLNKKIELLQKTIIQFEKAKTWFYRTKGGTIYFQDMYEHLHNSRNDDFSYIDRVKEDLEECIRKRDYVIPKTLDIIKSSNGILQRDIYQHLPDVSKSEVQKIIRDFESEGLITREKSGNSYLLTFKEIQ